MISRGRKLYHDLQASANHDSINITFALVLVTVCLNNISKLFLQFDLDGSQDVPIKRDIEKGV